MREARPRFHVDKARGLELAQAFFAASRSGDMSALGAMLADDVSLHADGGGKRPALGRPVFGIGSVMKLHAQLAEVFRKRGSTLVHAGFINGLPGFVTREADGELQTTALDIENGKVAAIYVVRNPEKLQHLHRASRGGFCAAVHKRSRRSASSRGS
ncbi:RNA polymerase sigma-70 factor, ECF subfamily [Paraburkholderia lycopersici]|uniref:RNA polymerase sigma-70 factor, ECF subfamily n=1 Tax=Paraburkholderia lycopersici TaxID=416944 RepID=A0A1G6M2W6_9BURK|nr:RNA polymerase sigma-70 factor, ECF subfamily [Paraburkholderia lycopersici]